jgi:hypothetical protein
MAKTSDFRECLWSLRLSDAILSLCVYCDDDSPTIRIFAGLADGTCAVLEVFFFYLKLFIGYCLNY